MTEGCEIKQSETGKWLYAGMEFSSKEAAQLFADRNKKSSNSSYRSLWLLACAVAAVWFGGSWLFGVVGEKARPNNAYYSAPTRVEAQPIFGAAEALYKCAQAIKRASRDAERTTVPFVAHSSAGNQYRFAWSNDSKLVRSPNGLGIEVGVHAICSVDGDTEQITTLIVQGRRLM